MKQFKLSKGLNLPILGAPRQEISGSDPVKRVGIIGDDYIGLKPSIVVSEGESVGPGSPVMFDKNMPDALIVSPISGKVVEINRGARRKLVSIVIEADENAGDSVDFSEVGDASTREGLVSVFVLQVCGPRLERGLIQKCPIQTANPVQSMSQRWIPNHWPLILRSQLAKTLLPLKRV